MSAIRQFQARLVTLLLADERFADGMAAATPGKGNVIADLPGDIETAVSRAVAELGLAVVVWTPAVVPVDGADPQDLARRMEARVWFIENVTMNRSAEGALYAEEAAEAADELLVGRANGLAGYGRGYKPGRIALGEGGIRPIGGETAENNTFEMVVETRFRRGEGAGLQTAGGRFLVA
jgi:hypothetical protein